jgi:hypothetical protein
MLSWLIRATGACLVTSISRFEVIYICRCLCGLVFSLLLGSFRLNEVSFFIQFTDFTLFEVAQAIMYDGIQAFQVNGWHLN